MSKLDDLRKYMSDLFAAAEDKDTVSKFAVVTKQIDEIEAETKASQENYKKLLDDYKDVVIHSSSKPLNSSDKGAAQPNGSFDADKVFMEALNSVIQNKQ